MKPGSASRLPRFVVADKAGNHVENYKDSVMSCNKDSLTKDQFLEGYSEAFTGLGNLGKPVSFILDRKVQPVHAPIHRIPVAKRERVKTKLDNRHNRQQTII